MSLNLPIFYLIKSW